MRTRIILFVFIFSAVSTAVGALDLRGEWALRPLAGLIETESPVVTSGDLDEFLVEGDVLAFFDLFHESFVIDVNAERKIVTLSGEAFRYTTENGRMRIEADADDFMDFTFIRVGSAVMCVISLSEDGMPYAMLFEAVPGPGATIDGAAPDAQRRIGADIFPGSRFENRATGIAFEFRGNRVAVFLDGRQTGVFPYEYDDGYLYIDDPQHGEVEFEIINDETIYTAQRGLRGEYERTR